MQYFVIISKLRVCIVYSLIYEDITHLLCGRLYIMTQDLSPPCSKHLYFDPSESSVKDIPLWLILFFSPPPVCSPSPPSLPYMLSLFHTFSFILLHIDYCATA